MRVLISCIANVFRLVLADTVKQIGLALRRQTKRRLIPMSLLDNSRRAVGRTVLALQLFSFKDFLQELSSSVWSFVEPQMPAHGVSLYWCNV